MGHRDAGIACRGGGGGEALIVEYLLERREDCNLKMKL